MIGGSLTRYDPNRGTRSTESGRPSNQTGGLSIKGLDTASVLQSLPRALKRKAPFQNRVPKKRKRFIHDIFE